MTGETFRWGHAVWLARVVASVASGRALGTSGPCLARGPHSVLTRPKSVSERSAATEIAYLATKYILVLKSRHLIRAQDDDDETSGQTVGGKMSRFGALRRTSVGSWEVVAVSFYAEGERAHALEMICCEVCRQTRAHCTAETVS